MRLLQCTAAIYKGESRKWNPHWSSVHIFHHRLKIGLPRHEILTLVIILVIVSSVGFPFQDIIGDDKELVNRTRLKTFDQMGTSLIALES
ncbi:hypothetical protein OPV22_032825 [Ensete ventricosum]|uniref:Uncharacterized protein n=1 Tax=Ensete ventricosum TaxID=4639 RepID=A0AAV8Q0B8_ENSVE|nr:hypothetical protein OPV22_032825 [Ensete ventricosum]